MVFNIAELETTFSVHYKIIPASRFRLSDRLLGVIPNPAGQLLGPGRYYLGILFHFVRVGVEGDANLVVPRVGAERESANHPR